MKADSVAAPAIAKRVLVTFAGVTHRWMVKPMRVMDVSRKRRRILLAASMAPG